MTNTTAAQNESPGQRAVQYWFADGLPEIVFGLFVFLWVGVGIITTIYSSNRWVEWSGMGAFCVSYFLWLGNYREVMEFLKARLTYPRAGYVQPPELPFPDQSLFPSLFPRLKPDPPITLRNAPVPSKNMSDFRLRAIVLLGLALLIGISSGILIGVYFWGKWIVALSMTVMAVLVFFMSRKDAHSYSWWSVLPIALAGFLAAFLELPPEASVVAPACILGAWFLIRGTWTLIRFLKSHPRLNEMERGRV